MAAVHDHDVAHAHDHHPSGMMRWLMTTNHKDIGTMYLWFSFIMFLTGGVMALTIRAELFQPGMQIVQPEFFNQLTTMHGLVMVFGAIMPAFVGFANWQIPMMIGAPDMAFARMNNWSFWLLPPAAMLLDRFVLCARRRAGGRLDNISAALGADGHGHGHGDICSPYHGRFLHHGIDQHHHHHPQHARAGHDADENAAVRMDLAHHRLSAGDGNAGAGGSGHHAVDRPQLRHQFL